MMDGTAVIHATQLVHRAVCCWECFDHDFARLFHQLELLVPRCDVRASLRHSLAQQDIDLCCEAEPALLGRATGHIVCPR